MNNEIQNMVTKYLNISYKVDLQMLETLHDGIINNNYDKILKNINSLEHSNINNNINLATLIMEIELLFDVNRTKSFWYVHDWLKSNVHKHIKGGGNKKADENLNYILGWFTQMI